MNLKEEKKIIHFISWFLLILTVAMTGFVIYIFPDRVLAWATIGLFVVSVGVYIYDLILGMRVNKIYGHKPRRNGILGILDWLLED